MIDYLGQEIKEGAWIALKGGGHAKVSSAVNKNNFLTVDGVFDEDGEFTSFPDLRVEADEVILCSKPLVSESGEISMPPDFRTLRKAHPDYVTDQAEGLRLLKEDDKT